ncbi:MAG: hypothetical protein AAF439_06800 [Pseudomonadota bacterium]
MIVLSFVRAALWACKALCLIAIYVTARPIVLLDHSGIEVRGELADTEIVRQASLRYASANHDPWSTFEIEYRFYSAGPTIWGTATVLRGTLAKALRTRTVDVTYLPKEPSVNMVNRRYRLAALWILEGTLLLIAAMNVAVSNTIRRRTG